MRGHASIWWDGVQVARRSKGKEKTKSWSRMVTKLKGKFLPKDYQLSLFRKMQNLKQRLMTIKEHTKEFYKVIIRAWHVEDTSERVASI